MVARVVCGQERQLFSHSTARKRYDISYIQLGIKAGIFRLTICRFGM